MPTKRARVGRFDAGLGEQAANSVRAQMDLPALDRLDHLFLARTIVAERHELLQFELIGGTSIQLRAGRGELQALAHDGRRDGEGGRDVLLALALLLERGEGAKLVDGCSASRSVFSARLSSSTMPVVLTMQGIGAFLASGCGVLNRHVGLRVWTGDGGSLSSTTRLHPVPAPPLSLGGGTPRARRMKRRALCHPRPLTALVLLDHGYAFETCCVWIGTRPHDDWLVSRCCGLARRMAVLPSAAIA